MVIVDVVLGSLVLGLAGWALVQTGTKKPAGRGGCGCGSHACGPAEPAAEDEPLVTLGGGAEDPARER